MVQQRVPHKLAALLQHLLDLVELLPEDCWVLLLLQSPTKNVHVGVEFPEQAEMLRKYLHSHVYPFLGKVASLTQFGSPSRRLLDFRSDCSPFFFGSLLGRSFREYFLVTFFFVFFVLGTGVEEREGSVEAIALDCKNEVVEVELVVIFASSHGEQVELGYLQVASNGKTVLHVVSCPVQVGMLRKEVLHIIHREVPLVFLELLGKGPVQRNADPLLGGEVFIEHQRHRVIVVAVFDVREHSAPLIEFGKQAGTVAFIGEEEDGFEEFFDWFDGNVGGSFVFEGSVGADFAVDVEEEVLGVEVEVVGEVVGAVEEGVVAHHSHQLAKHFGLGPIPTSTLPYRLQYFREIMNSNSFTSANLRIRCLSTKQNTTNSSNCILFPIPPTANSPSWTERSLQISYINCLVQSQGSTLPFSLFLDIFSRKAINVGLRAQGFSVCFSLKFQAGSCRSFSFSWSMRCPPATVGTLAELASARSKGRVSSA